MYEATRLETTTTTTTLTSGRVSGDRSDILNTTNSHTSTGKGTKGSLTTRTGSLGTGTTGSSELNVKSVDTEFLTLGSNLLGSQHSSIRRRLITISLNLHTTSNTRDGFTTREIGNVNESIVERSKDVGNAENEFTFTDLGAKSDLFNNLRGNLLVRL
jgi:hypothetical protein